MKSKYILPIIIFITLTGCLFSCTKTDFLNAKSRSSLVVPSTLQDFQALLDNSSVMNLTPALGEYSTDNYFAAYSFLQSQSVRDQNTYTWASDIFQGTGNQADWNIPYQQIYTSNEVLDGLNNVAINAGNQASWNLVKGSALFFRASAFYNLAQVFASAYDSSTAATDLGIPLKLSSDVNMIVGRSSVKATYDQILSDLTIAENLLPNSFDAQYRNRPSKLGAMALLSRIYLSMRNYTKAGAYADSSLQLYNSLIDYNTLPAASSAPFIILNNETIWQTSAVGGSNLYFYLCGFSNQIGVDSNLYRSYATNDLRRSIFFSPFSNGVIALKVGYNRAYNAFSGLATDELYLNRAECSARAGNMNSAMADLNTLLQNRWKAGTFIPLLALNASDALNQILMERRKELLFRIRWIDLKRLNKGGANITLTRILNGQTYTLAPNSPLYVFPIPPDEIQLSGIQQNIR